MTLTETLPKAITDAIAGTALGALIIGAIVLFVIIIIAVWIYTSLAWQTIGKKLRHKNPWLAWIPFARTGLVLSLGKFHRAWAFLYLIPILGWTVLAVLCIIARWRIFEIRNYSGWLALVPLAGIIPFLGGLAGIAYLIILGIVAWKAHQKAQQRHPLRSHPMGKDARKRR